MAGQSSGRWCLLMGQGGGQYLGEGVGNDHWLGGWSEMASTGDAPMGEEEDDGELVWARRSG
jgi:hypothetical protein